MLYWGNSVVIRYPFSSAFISEPGFITRLFIVIFATAPLTGSQNGATMAFVYIVIVPATASVTPYEDGKLVGIALSAISPPLYRVVFTQLVKMQSPFKASDPPRISSRAPASVKVPFTLTLEFVKMSP
jgi:hypothetical protein